MASVDYSILAASSYGPFDDLHLGRSNQQFVRHLLHFWDAMNMKAEEFMGVVLLLLDEKKLSRIIRGNKAREVSLTSMPLTADNAEKLGFVNHVVEQGEALKKAREIAEAIIKNEQGMVLRIKFVINDGLYLDLGHALTLKKERGHAYYCGMTKEQFKKMQEFITGRGSKKPTFKLYIIYVHLK